MSAPSRTTLREAALLGGVALALLLDGAVGSGDGLSGPGVLAVAATVAVLSVRRRAPLAVVPAMCLAIAACLATLTPGDTVFLPGCVAAYAAALYGDRRRSSVLAVVLVPVVLGLVLGFSSDLEVGKMLFNAGAVAVAILVGDAVRARRAAREADRARREQEGRERELDARRRVAEERLRIARDVHDVVAHSMVAINVQAGVAAHLLRTRPEHAEDALREIKRVSGAALDDLRATLGVLRADDGPGGSALRPTDPLGRLDEPAEPLRAAGITVRIDLRGDPSSVPTAVGTAAFRIVQEALTNVLRHAAATSVAVEATVSADHVAVVVTDDGHRAEGRGPGRSGESSGDHPAAGEPRTTDRTAVPIGPPEEDATRGAGAGLRGMRERAATVGGIAEAGPAPDGTWTVRARLPLHPVPGASG